MEMRNQELGTILLYEIRGVLQRNYKTAEFDLINVDYSRIFGIKEKDYGDFDIVFFSNSEKELYLVEAKYFSDSLNGSGMTNDYEKIFKEGGYYDHCRARYDLVLDNPLLMKQFINVEPNTKIKAHLLFVSSKPIEMELQDKDGIVTFLSLSTFEGFIQGKLISEDGEVVIRPEVIL